MDKLTETQEQTFDLIASRSRGKGRVGVRASHSRLLGVNLQAFRALERRGYVVRRFRSGREFFGLTPKGHALARERA